MKRRLRFPAAVVLSVILASGLCGRAIADDSETKGRLTLTDLAGYRAALSGKPTADQSRAGTPPIRVTFKDLWNHNESRPSRNGSRPGFADLLPRAGRQLPILGRGLDRLTGR
jgi:hypothetical protein